MKHKRIRNDILLALAVLLAAGAFYWVFHTSSSRGQWAVIEQNGTEIARLSLFERTSYPVITDLGRNVIQQVMVVFGWKWLIVRMGCALVPEKFPQALSVSYACRIVWLCVLKAARNRWMI